MKEAEINQCLRLYRKSVDSYCKLIDKLTAAQAATVGMPLIRRRLVEAEEDLSQIGEGISVLPELAEEILAERRLRTPEGAVCRPPAEDWDDGLLD